MSVVDDVAREKLDAIRARGTHRRMRVLDGAQAPRMVVDGRDVLLFAGSNYLDLAHHPEVVEAAARAARDYGCAAGGSRLITGNLTLHERLEEELAAFFGTRVRARVLDRLHGERRRDPRARRSRRTPSSPTRSCTRR